MEVQEKEVRKKIRAIDTSFIKIPYPVLYNEELNDLQKLLLAQILALTTNKNYCYANNMFFAIALNKSKVTISRNISELQKLGYISVEQKDKRRIYVKRAKLHNFDLEEYKSKMSMRMIENDKGISEFDKADFQKGLDTLIDTDKDNKELNTEENIKIENTKNEESDDAHHFLLFLITSLDKIQEEYAYSKDYPQFFDSGLFYKGTTEFLYKVFSKFNIEPSFLYSTVLDKIATLPHSNDGGILDFFYESFADFIGNVIIEADEADRLSETTNPIEFSPFTSSYKRFILDSYEDLMEVYYRTFIYLDENNN